ncbi:MAG: ribosome maturation factor RimM, partial [Janthinobacterium lividum]
MSSWTLLARILRPQGRKGEVLAELFTDFPADLKGRANLFLAPEHFDDGDPSSLALAKIVSSWMPSGKNEGRIVLMFAGATTIEDAERFSGLTLVTPLEDRTALADDSFYISDLLGCALYDRGEKVGVVEDLQFPTTSDGRRKLTEAAPLLLIRLPSGPDLLVPFVKEFLISIDVD